MSADRPFSVADSEWSRDDSEGERYVSVPMRDFHAERRMYDIPPHVEAARSMMTSDGPTSPVEENKGKSQKSVSLKVSTQSGDRPRRPKLPFCIKMYLFGLTVGFIMLLCVVIFLMIQQKSLQQQQFDNDEGVIYDADVTFDEVELIRQKVSSIQDNQRVLLQFLRQNASWRGTSSTPTATNVQGCTKSDHIRVNSSCYSLLTWDVGISNIEAEYKCWTETSGAKLAMFKDINVQQYLGRQLQSVRYWIDGYKGTTRGSIYVFADGTAVNQTWLRRTKGAGCLSIGISAGSNTTEWLETGCFDKLRGCICQYPAPKVV